MKKKVKITNEMKEDFYRIKANQIHLTIKLIINKKSKNK